MTLKHISGFLKQIPDENLCELCSVLKLENIKREEVLFNMGDQPDKFYILLTGLVELTEKLVTNDLREKFVIANLKKGQAFGETAILNNKPRNATCVAVSNCTVLTVEKDDFLGIMGPHFFGQKREIVTFLKSHISAFKDVGRNVCLSLMAFMMKLHYSPDTEWDIYRERHIYFIRRGYCGLYHGEYYQQSHRTKTGSKFFTSTSENSGLDEVEVVDGQAIGSLGRESEKRSQRKQALLQKELASLCAGDWFGGGADILGEGAIQRRLRVFSKTEIEAFVVPLDDFLAYGHPEMIRRLREDACFRLTYIAGRKGITRSRDVIGHHSLGLTPVTKSRNESLPQKRTRRVEHQLSQTEGLENDGFSPEISIILQSLRDIHRKDELDVQAARYNCGTPTERYWSESSLTRGLAHHRLDPLLKEIYVRGYSPLVTKLERLHDRKLWRTRSMQFPSYGQDIIARKIDLVAAAVMWDRRKPPTPGLRQCLTYAEIIRNKSETFKEF